MYYPTLEEVKNRTQDGNLVPVYREVVADLDTPVSVFMKIHHRKTSFLLESVEGGQRLARYSFIGTDPYKIMTFRKEDNADPLDLISRELYKFKTVPVEGLPRFSGGAVGYLGYETIRHFEDISSPDADPYGLPEAMFMLTDTMLIFDHVTHKIKILSHVRLDNNIDEAYAEATQRIDDLAGLLLQPLPAVDRAGAETASRDYVSNYSAETFAESVRRIKEYICAGEAIQVVLSQRLTRKTGAAPFEIYRALRTINPSPYMYYLDFQDFQIIGASPEILVRVEDGKVMTRPLAGTRPRGSTQEEDSRLEQELRQDEKERAEHVMLVDLGRNDIGRVSQPGTVAVSELMDVERYSHVMHMVTHVQGKLRSGMTAFDALRACFPAGTVSGAPKIRAMEIIAQLEPDRRGPYAGACGYFSFSGNMDMAIAIRTIILKQGTASVQAGCGIVYDSIPEKEYEETLNKARALLKALDQAEGRTEV